MTVRQSQTLVRVASLIGGLLLLLISATFGRAEESKRPVAAGVVAPLATKLEMLMQEQRQRDLHNLTVRIGATPAAINTTPQKIAALVRAAR